MLPVIQWVYGFWSGWNWANELQEKFQKEVKHQSLEYDALKARMIAYCYEKPDEVLFGFAVEMYLDLPDLAQ